MTLAPQLSRCLPIEDVAADLPVQQDQFAVDRERGVQLRRLNASLQVGKELRIACRARAIPWSLNLPLSFISGYPRSEIAGNTEASNLICSELVRLAPSRCLDKPRGNLGNQALSDGRANGGACRTPGQSKRTRTTIAQIPGCKRVKGATFHVT